MSEATVSMPVSALIGDDIITVDVTATLAEAAKVLSDSDVGAVAVSDADDLVGILSERDVVRVVAGGSDPSVVTAGEVASRELVRCDAVASVAEVSVEMLEHYVRHVVVLEGGVPVGIVSARDLLGVYAGDDLADED